MIERCDRAINFVGAADFSVGESFDPSAACAAAGMKSRSSNSMYRTSCKLPEPLEARHRDDDRVHVPGLQLGEARVDVSSQGHHRVRIDSHASNFLRGDEVPSFAPFGSALSDAPFEVISASCGFSRSGVATMRNSGGSTAGRSFIEWTAISTRRSASACSNSLMNNPLPPTSASDGVRILSPLVLIGTISMVRSAIADAIASRTISAWMIASLLGRNPILSVAFMVQEHNSDLAKGFDTPWKALGRKSRSPSTCSELVFRRTILWLLHQLLEFYQRTPRMPRFIEIDSRTYDLSHLDRFSFDFVVAQKDGRPAQVYSIRSCSAGTATRAVSRRVKPSLQGLLAIRVARDTPFDERRYRLSIQLPDIIRDIGSRKCFHTGKGNFFIVASGRE